MGLPTAIASGALAVGTTVLFTGHNYLDSIQILTDGANPGTVTVYDNTAASGKIVAVLSVPAANLSGSVVFDRALRADIGLTVVVAGTGAQGFVGYGAA